MDVFRVRLNNVDHYQSPAGDFDPPLFGTYGSTQRADAPNVPVIRVFGATETGQKVCAHIHGALPYLFVEYRGSVEKGLLNAYIQQLRASINHALAVSYRRNTYDGKAVYVGHITLIKGVPFFGYHVGYRFFLKIYMLNPLHMTRFADLLHQGAIMAQVFQPFESHLQYLLQWMCDFNLYGCSYIECKAMKFRGPVPAFEDIENSQHKWHDEAIDANQYSDPIRYPRQSHCSIEVDIRVEDILNREDVHSRELHADFLERHIKAAPDEKLVRSLAGLWRDETRRRKLRMGLTDPSSSPFPAEVLVSMSADPRNNENGGWIHELEFRELIEELVQQERPKVEEVRPTFDNFLHPAVSEANVQTVLESVTDLFSNTLETYFAHFGSSMSQDGELISTMPAIVDESSISRFEEHDFPYESDDDNHREPVEPEIIHDPTIGEAVNADSAHSLKRRTCSNPDDEDERRPRPEKTNGSFSTGHDDSAYASTSTWKSDHPSKRVRLSSPSRIASEGFPGPDTDLTQRQDKVASKSSSQPIVTGANMNGGQFLPSSSPVSNPLNANPDEGPKPSSQLSQSSIKSHGPGSTPRSSFPTIKNAHFNRPSTASPKHKPGPAMPDHTMSKAISSSKVRFTDCQLAPTAALLGSKATQFVLSSRIAQLAASFEDNIPDIKCTTTTFYGIAPPAADFIVETLAADGRPSVVYQDAYYSNEKDVPERARDYAGREFKLESTTTPYLPLFDETGALPSSSGVKVPVIVDRSRLDAGFQQKREDCNLRAWEFAVPPPSYNTVVKWFQKELSTMTTKAEAIVKGAIGRQSEEVQPIHDVSQIEGPTQRNKHGFKFTQNKNSTSVKHETQYMSIMSLELHVNTRGTLVPNPEEDSIACVFWSFKSDDARTASQRSNGVHVGILVLSEHGDVGRRIAKESRADVEEEDSELDLLNRMVDIVREYDPDVLTGYEVHNSSWGYMIERARLKYEYNLCDEFSRMKSQSHGRFGKEADRWGFNNTSTIRVTGRHMINIWRAMRSELNLLQYTMENVAFHLLHKRITHYSFRNLTKWYTSNTPRDVAKVLEYFLSRVQVDLDILDANELIPRTSEQARLIGVDFFSVFSRGSQFKVESFMFRIAKPENFILVSPSRKQVGQQNALECLPLVMEPQSSFYPGPVLVLDFQSLYPSIMIAYNYCYSTCLGRIVNWRGQNKLGFADFKRQPRLLELVKDSVNIAPNGMMYVKPEMRKSLLAKMLGEILETRVMVKSGMKVDKDDKTLQQLLNNRQLALKLLANVTYGYTSASFSGRMPCSEIADSIVQTGRETLEKAIALIHSVHRWGAEVVYGDTDSLFVHLNGRTKDEAFKIGNEIAKAVTDLNPRPMKLKFEKVYFPCVLLAKKRYVGFKYESPTQIEPEFDAKGIETVRRDGTPAEQKIEEKCLKMLFRTADLSQVKRYFQKQCTKIMLGQVSIQDFCFAREVKLGTYADKGPPPPGALISTRKMLEDPRLEPQYGERVPYVVITGAPGARLIDRCVAPEQLLKDDGVELDAEYYISKNLIPPLERIFNLVGANVRQWFDEMPKVQRIRDIIEQPPQSVIAGVQKYAPNGAPIPLKKTLENYMKSSTCMVCRAKLPPSRQRDAALGGDFKDDTENDETTRPLPLCEQCLADTPNSLYALHGRVHAAQRSASQVEAVCRSCSGLSWAEDVACDSKDCPVFYSRVKARAREQRIRVVTEEVTSSLEQRAVEVDW